MPEIKEDPISLVKLLYNKDNTDLKEFLNKQSEEEIASIVEEVYIEEKVKIFAALDHEQAHLVFEYLPIKMKHEIVKALPPALVSELLIGMHPDDRTLFLEDLPRQSIDEFIKLLPPEDRILTLTLLGYPENTVGRLMTTDYIAVKRDWTIEQVLEKIQEYGHESQTIDYIYVVDDHDVLIDDIKLIEMLFVPKNFLVEQVGDFQFLAIKDLDDVEVVVPIFEQFKRTALPVVDENGVLLGIVNVDDILREVSERATEDFQKAGGVEALDEPYMDVPFFELMQKRAKWLGILFIGEMLTATAMGHFEEDLSKAIVLSIFLPLIISSGGNAGSQSSTLIIRAMSLGEVKISDWFRIMKREILSGVFLGVVLGAIGFFRVMVWGGFFNAYGEHYVLIGLTIFFSLIGIVLWGSLSGSMLPLLLKKLNADPATSSTPLVATMVDVTGILIYFTIASIVLKGTLM